MEFGVLGPLEIHDGARAVDLPPQRRDLLALLLCRPNTVVSADALVDGLWGEAPPRTAAKSLQIQLHHLRRALDDDDRLVHRAPGYLLTVGPDELDATRFERLVERGRAALAEGRTGAGVDLLRQALTLWRGPAFAGLDHLTMAADEAQRLAEQRRTAEEDLLDAELDLGNHADVVGRLTALVAEHPFRERPRAQLILALYRLGRRAEALDVYREGRKVLADELGLEPGPRLRDLQRAILVNDPALDLPRRESPSAQVPAELPLDIATFTGRSGEVERLRAMLTADPGSPVIAAINGVGGSGKSALAVRAAHEVATAFPDGQLYVNLRGSTVGLERLPAMKVLGRWSRTLGASGEHALDDVDEAAARFRSLTAGRKMLIVLDDAADAAQVRPLLPGAPGCAVLITSRRMLSTLDGVVHLRLDVMSEAEALTVLDRLAVADRVAADPDGAARVAELCG
ncbi:AfsR/SARP family transcriptional regulator, partial [Actinoallomurus acaciae]